MTFPAGYPFANLAAGNQPASLLDAVFAALGSASNIMCTASGTTSNVVLTPQTGFFSPTAYITGQTFRFTAVNTMVVNPTIQVGALASLNAYMDDGATQIPVGWIANGKTYDAQYLLSLNGGAGGFIVRGALQDILNARPNVNFGNTDAVLNITVPNISGHPGGSSFWVSVPDTQSGSATAQFHSWGTGTESSLNMCHARGVAGTPTALQLGDSLGVYGMAGYSDPVNGFQSGNGASQVALQGFADENFTSTTKGVVFGVLTVPRGSITRNTAFKVDGNANVIIEPPNAANNTGLALPGQGVLFMGAATAPTSGKTGYYQTYVSGGQFNIENPGNVGVAAQPATTNAGATYFASVSYGTGNVPRFSGFMARGVHGTPTATQSGDVVGQFDASGLETGAFSLSATVQMTARENWVAGAHGTSISFGATANTTTAVLEQLRILGVASAVNYITLKGSATTTAVVISADGTDGNISVNIAPKGSGTAQLSGLSYPTSLTQGGVIYATSSTALACTAGYGQIVGTSTNDSASAGNVGEYVSATVLASASIAAGASGTPKDITSISLTAGDWDVWGTAGFLAAAGTTSTVMGGWISTTSATQPTGPNNGAFTYTNQSFPTAATEAFPTGNIRLSLAVTTTVYVSANATYAVSTMNIFGGIFARRRR